MPDRSIRVVRPGDPAKVIYGAGDKYRYLATGDHTDGQYFIVEAFVPPGGGPPLHVQTREEEGFYIISGTLTFYDGEGTAIAAGTGTFLNVPKGARHRFRNEGGDPARMLLFFAPAGIETLFDELDHFHPSADPAAAIAALNAIGEKYGARYFP